MSDPPMDDSPTGDSPTGDPPTGDPPMGDPPMGDHQMDDPPMDDLQIDYTNPLMRTPSVDEAVRKCASNDTRKIDQFLIKCTPENGPNGGNTWHAGGTDPDQPTHITVKCSFKGKVVSVWHVDRDGKRC